MKPSIDINCDMGEGLDNEAQLMPYITSCNIACGAHAGSIETIDNVVALAVAHQVKIGVHPSYPDREHFGRVSMKISTEELSESIAAQIRLFLDRLNLVQAPLHHIKFHGALYNDAAHDVQIAHTLLQVVKAELPESVKLYAPHGSAIARLAEEEGWPLAYEVFMDRAYHTDLRLVSRSSPNALLTQKEQVLANLKNLMKGYVLTVEGEQVPVVGTTFCVHGDTPGAETILHYIHQYLKES